MDLSEGIKLSCNGQLWKRCVREGVGGRELQAQFSLLAALLWFIDLKFIMGSATTLG